MSKSRTSVSSFMQLLDSSWCPDAQALLFERSGQPGAGAWDQREPIRGEGEGVWERPSLTCKKA